jgi:adenylosuccinate synthase
MPLEIVIGAQWGDEGKGRVVDLLAGQADLVVRFNGGDNAGHTVATGGKTFKLHQIPSGIIHPHTISLMAAGMVVNPASLWDEMEMLEKAGVTVNKSRLFVSHAAHIITPAHRALDQAKETSLGKGQIGTTGRGIGPAYTDKVNRTGIRAEEMLAPERFRQRVLEQVTQVNQTLSSVYQMKPIDAETIAEQYRDFAEKFAPYICDTGILIADALLKGKCVLAEGAQGTLLDLDYGTYPFVTSSTCTAPGALVGMGIGVWPVERVIGVVKAFQTRVGSGQFPTELLDADAVSLRGTGSNPWDEFGTTTGRPRRVGWLDGVLLRYAVRVNGLTELAITKLDILSGFPSVRICRAYRKDGTEYPDLPLGPAELADFEPVYEELNGWSENVQTIREIENLPKAAQEYIQFLESLCGVPVRWISVGPERDQIICAA